MRGPKGRGKLGTPLIRHGLAAVTPSPQGGRQSDVIRPGELTFSRGSRLQSRAACVILCTVRVKSAATQIFAYWETIIAHQSPKVNRLWGFFSVLTKSFSWHPFRSTTFCSGEGPFRADRSVRGPPTGGCCSLNSITLSRSCRRRHRTGNSFRLRRYQMRSSTGSCRC